MSFFCFAAYAKELVLDVSMIKQGKKVRRVRSGVTHNLSASDFAWVWQILAGELPEGQGAAAQERRLSGRRSGAGGSLVVRPPCAASAFRFPLLHCLTSYSLCRR
jgi:hypothetical protein